MRNGNLTEVGSSREIHFPKTEQEWLAMRVHDVTSTEVAALFGIHPWLTHFELWHQKKAATVVRIEPSERMKWGTRLQDPIAQGLASDNGWEELAQKKEYMRLGELRIGSSFDSEITVDGRRGLLEVKNVDSMAFKEGWLVDEFDNVEAPTHIEIQVQHQLMVTGMPFAFIGALVGGNKGVPIYREPDLEIQEKIVKAVKDFWLSIEQNQEPKPDFRRDADFIAKLYSKTQAGLVKDLHEDDELAHLATTYKSLADRIKDLEGEKDALKAKMLMKVGEAEKVQGNGFSMTLGIVKGGPVSYTREDYRNFRINWPKKKGEK